MTGKELFEKYRTGADKEYSQLLTTAFFVVGEKVLFANLENAEKEGKRIKLTYPIPFNMGPSDPNGITLV